MSHAAAYLGDAERAPLFLPQQLQGASAAVKVLLGYGLEHLLRELDVTVLVLLVRISVGASAGCAIRCRRKRTQADAPCRVVDRLDELLQLLLFVLGQRAGLLVAAREVDVHVLGHDGVAVQQWARVVCSCFARLPGVRSGEERVERSGDGGAGAAGRHEGRQRQGQRGAGALEREVRGATRLM